jgi:hypothetical protein
MRRTGWSQLAVIAVALGVAGWLFARLAYGSLPPLSYALPVPIGALAVAELIAARRVRGAVRHERWAKPMAALVIARCVALGKASSLVGAGMLGAFVGLIVELLPDVGSLSAVGHDVDVSIVVIAAALLLAAAGLLLERAGIDPGRDRESRP